MIARASEIREDVEYLVCACNGQRRYVRAHSPYAAMLSVAASIMTQDDTSRPAFREMIDTIHWGEVR